MTVEIRLIQTIAEYRAAEQVQREVWNLEEVEIVPDHLLLTTQKNGGLVMGAFDRPPEGENEQLVGFVFGFAGLTAAGQVKHCSHMTGVLPARQNLNLGYRLKLAQREHTLAQGIDLVTWTFDPLESRNARLNFHKLGVTCNTYLRNLYGDIRDALNAGLPSDRFQVDWYVASARVAGRLHSDWVESSLAALEATGIPILNRFLPGDLPRPPQTTLPVAGEQLLIQIPARFQAIKATDMGLARAWRTHTRELFEAAFALGYTAVDLLFENERSCYLLKKNWSLR
ncbi:MAG: hypothetical protein U9R15_10350 [Chloroflexota bacterium]|nr:hypothetical protein [Chloroflexota bacterium]